MAVFNEIQVGRYNRLLQKLLSMKGGPPAPSLAGEIIAEIPLFHGVENRYLEGWERFGFFGSIAAAVGVNSFGRLRNPPGSNVIAVLESLTGRNVTTQGLTFGAGPTTTVIAGEASAGSIEGRGRTSSAMLASISTNLVALPIRTFRVQPAAAVSIEFILTENQEFVLVPGTALEVATFNPNEGLTFGCTWRERFLEDSERT